MYCDLSLTSRSGSVAVPPAAGAFRAAVWLMALADRGAECRWSKRSGGELLRATRAIEFIVSCLHSEARQQVEHSSEVCTALQRRSQTGFALQRLRGGWRSPNSLQCSAVKHSPPAQSSRAHRTPTVSMLGMLMPTVARSHRRHSVAAQPSACWAGPCRAHASPLLRHSTRRSALRTLTHTNRWSHTHSLVVWMLSGRRSRAELWPLSFCREISAQKSRSAVRFSCTQSPCRALRKRVGIV